LSYVNYTEELFAFDSTERCLPGWT